MRAAGCNHRILALLLLINLSFPCNPTHICSHPQGHMDDFSWKVTAGLFLQGFVFVFILITRGKLQKSVSGIGLIQTGRILPPHLCFCHHRNFPLLCFCHPHMAHTLCVHFFLLHIPHRVCLSYTMCKSVISSESN